MKKSFLFLLLSLFILSSCNKDKEILNALNTYNLEMEGKGYHFGDELQLPKNVTEEAKEITISFGDKKTSSLKIDPAYYTLGDNSVTYIITKKDGSVLNQDATINVFAKIPEADLQFEVVAEYPHDPKNFVQGFQLEGNTIYESDGQNGASRLIKYSLGTTAILAENKQSNEIFSEGAAIVGDKIYQLTWRNKKGFIYDKNTFKLLSEFSYNNMIGEGWGLTYDGKNLLLSDGTKNIYFLDLNDPSKLIKYISVAGNSTAYDQLNELEYHKGFLYANVWQKPVVLKINPANGEVVGKFDFSDLAAKNTKDATNDVLNGIAFKGDNMLITGKLWSKIYEIKIK